MDPSPPRSPAMLRLFGSARFLVLLLGILTLYGFLITYGTWHFVENEIRGDTYDSLGESLLRGEATVSQPAINSEAFIVNGKVFTYFAPMPAFLRVAFDFFYPDYYGRWSRVSCMLASLLILLGFAGFLDVCLRKNPRLAPATSVRLFILSFAGLALGSPVVYLMSCGYIYHEASLWGIAGCMVVFYFFARIFFLNDYSLGALAGYSFFTGFTFLSRMTFALPWAAAAVFLFFRILLDAGRRRGEGPPAKKPWPAALCRVLILIIPMTAGFAYYGWYNWIRFGSPFTFLDFRYYSIFHNNAGWTFIHETGGNNLRRLAAGFLNYFWPQAGNFSFRPPFVHMVIIHDITPDLYLTNYREWVLAVPLASSWLVAGALAGAFLVYRKKGRAAEKFLTAAFLPQCVIILTFYFITHRYAFDLYPLLIYLYGFFLVRFPFDDPRAERAAVGVLEALVAVSILINVLSTFSWAAYDNWAVPWEWGERLRGIFGGMESSMQAFMSHYGGLLFAVILR